jgi:hypothetical protein
LRRIAAPVLGAASCPPIGSRWLSDARIFSSIPEEKPMHVTLAHIRFEPALVDAFLAAMMAEPSRGGSTLGLFPS